MPLWEEKPSYQTIRCDTCGTVLRSGGKYQRCPCDNTHFVHVYNTGWGVGIDAVYTLLDEGEAGDV